MNAPTDQTDKAARRKRRAPKRHVPAVIEHRERKPVIFGWGAGLNRQERDALKERIALFGGIGLAVVLVAVIGWGWYQDNVAAPAAAASKLNQPIVQVGDRIITTGFFKRFETFEQNSITTNLNNIQQQINALNQNAKKNSAQLAQLNAQQQSLQQQQANLAQNAEDTLISDYTVLQRASTVGVVAKPKDVDAILKQVQRRTGGPLHFQHFLSTSGLSSDEFRTLLTAEYLVGKVQQKLAAKTSHYQLKVRASHILVSTKQHALALKLYGEALHGANFSALARKYSTDTTSAKKGGDLGFFARGAMVKPFDQAAFAMKVGQIRLVRSQFGWHIIKVTARQTTRLNATEYQQAQQTAFNNWLNLQQGILSVRRYVSPQNLPQVATPTSQIIGR